MSARSQYRHLSRLGRVFATGWLVLFVAVWGGLPLADAATGHPGAAHGQLGGDEGDRAAATDTTCSFCELLATPVLASLPMASSAPKFVRGASVVRHAGEPLVAPQYRAHAARPPPAP